jgi:hypothetical protein
MINVHINGGRSPPTMACRASCNANSAYALRRPSCSDAPDRYAPHGATVISNANISLDANALATAAAMATIVARWQKPLSQLVLVNAQMV